MTSWTSLPKEEAFITLRALGRVALTACTDFDWASDSNNQRSQTGYFLKLAGGAISWTLRAQKTVALPSTEAEYMMLSDCSRQVVWMHTLKGELSGLSLLTHWWH